MAGIYLHIPFCEQKCNYCDFYSIVPQTKKQDFLNALSFEIIERKNYLSDSHVDTLYFGGGTPSVLTISEIDDILNNINKNYKVSSQVEITLEANPENLSVEYLTQLKRLGINRLSIGIQSFNNNDLEFLKRNHNSKSAELAVVNANKVGIDNISIDLIYGIPTLSTDLWVKNLEKAFSLPIKHLSSYHLTYEEGTVLYKKLKQGKFKTLVEEKSLEQFQLLMQYSEANKMPYYEISNFSSEQFYSKHNTSYWQQKKYLGFGPSAHSFNGLSREWNISNITKYIEGINNKIRNYESEKLSSLDKQNEYLITRLRTKWGIDIIKYETEFGKNNFLKLVERSKVFIESDLMKINEKNLTITKEGLLTSDYILERIFEI